MKELARIEIKVEQDEDTGDINVGFSASQLSLPEMNYWLDYVKNMVMTGQVNSAE